MGGKLNIPFVGEVHARLDLFDAQALSNLADALPEHQEEFLVRLTPTLKAFVAAMPTSLEEWAGGAFLKVLQETMVDNFGALGTGILFDQMGLFAAPDSFVTRALRRIGQVLAEPDFRKESFGLTHKRVLCYAEWDLKLSSGEPVRGTLLRENGIRVGHLNPPAWLRSFPTPINNLIGRDLCGEFQLIAGVGQLLDAGPPGRLDGIVLLFVSSTPCVSCVAAVRQFQHRFPHVRIGFTNGDRFERGMSSATSFNSS